MRSMTGFGTGEAASEEVRFTVSLTSVNRKQSDIVVNLPRSLAELDGPIRKRVAAVISRGRVSVQVQMETIAASQSALVVDQALANQYREAIEKLGTDWETPLKLEPADLLRAPGVFTVQESTLDLESAAPLIHEALEIGIRQLLETQDAEGLSLKNDLLERVGMLRRIAGEIAAKAPEVKTNWRDNLHRRLRESDIPVSFEDERFIREVGIFAERCDVTEELTRLDSHFEQFDRYFHGGEPSGRALDFLCQEVNREFNTIGSKANDAFIAQSVVEAKTELEKVREQVQNLQ